jgi:putative two-component system response regulator
MFRPDLVIVDLDLTHLQGFDALLELKRWCHPQDYVPIMMVTTDTASETREQALASGAMDVITKPFDAKELVLRAQILLKFRSIMVCLGRQGTHLEKGVRRKTVEACSRSVGVRVRFGAQAEIFEDSRERARRVSLMAHRIASELGVGPKQCGLIESAALLQAIGKKYLLGLVLQENWRRCINEPWTSAVLPDVGAELMASHGPRTLESTEKAVLASHEKWDGSGCCGLRGESIPLAGRITALAEVMDALVNEVGGPPRGRALAAIKQINAGAGTSFDPSVVVAFNELVRICPLAEAA